MQSFLPLLFFFGGHHGFMYKNEFKMNPKSMQKKINMGKKTCSVCLGLSGEKKVLQYSAFSVCKDCIDRLTDNLNLYRADSTKRMCCDCDTVFTVSTPDSHICPNCR